MKNEYLSYFALILSFSLILTGCTTGQAYSADLSGEKFNVIRTISADGLSVNLRLEEDSSSPIFNEDIVIIADMFIDTSTTNSIIGECAGSEAPTADLTDSTTIAWLFAKGGGMLGSTQLGDIPNDLCYEVVSPVDNSELRGKWGLESGTEGLFAGEEPVTPPPTGECDDISDVDVDGNSVLNAFDVVQAFNNWRNGIITDPFFVIQVFTKWRTCWLI